MTLQHDLGRRAFPSSPSRKAAAPSALKWFDELGERVAIEWRKANHAEDALAEIASSALDATPPSEHVEPGAIAELVLRGGELPPQADIEARFSDLPVTVYTKDRLHIQVLHWAQSSPAIHNHIFSGAFHLLSGSSLHETYGFSTTRRHGPRVREGVLTPRGVELLEKGDTRAIHRGDRFIHTVFHLGRPSVSVVVRSPGAEDESISKFEQSGFAWDPFYETPGLARVLQSITLHHKVGDGYQRAVSEALDAADEIAFVRILAHCRTLHYQEPEDLARVTREAQTRRPDLAAAVLLAFEDASQIEHLIGLRASLRNDDYRSTLGLLLFAPTRRRLLDLVARCVPGAAPEDTVTRCAGELTSYMGAGSGLEEHRLLATEPAVVAFRSLLEGKGDDATAADVAAYFDGASPFAAADVAALRRALGASRLFRCVVAGAEVAP